MALAFPRGPESAPECYSPDTYRKPSFTRRSFSDATLCGSICPFFEERYTCCRSLSAWAPTHRSRDQRLPEPSPISRVPAYRKLEVKATDIATGLQRETATNSQGMYTLTDLGVGTYLVEITKPGFATYRLSSVKQEVGQTNTLNMTLPIEGKSEQIEVTEAMVQLDKVDAVVGSPIEQKLVDDLPVNGRNWATLTSLAPGAIDNGAGDQRTIRFAGHGLDDNNLTLDGVDATAVLQSGTARVHATEYSSRFDRGVPGAIVRTSARTHKAERRAGR